VPLKKVDNLSFICAIENVSEKLHTRHKVFQELGVGHDGGGVESAGVLYVTPSLFSIAHSVSTSLSQYP
jgi:hypothetical protein